MKRVLPLLLVLGCGGTASEPSAPTGKVTGLITATQIPFAGAALLIADTGLEAVSGSDGTFVLQDVPVGFHWLHVTPVGYPAIDTAVFSVQPDETTELPPVDFEKDLTGAGALRGRVELAGTGAIAGASASLEGPSKQSVLSDANGYFAFASLSTGTYTLTVTLDRTAEGSQVLRDVLVTVNAVANAGTIQFTPESP